MPSQRTVAAQIKRLSEYQVAISHAEGANISDAYAKDLAYICASVSELAEEFLEENLQAEKQRPNFSVSRLYAKLPRVSLPSFSTFLRLTDTLTSMFQAYTQYQELKLKREKFVPQKWRCAYCTFMNRKNKELCEVCLKQKEREVEQGERQHDKDKEKQEEDRWNTLGKTVFTVGAVGTSVGAAAAMLKARDYKGKLNAASLCRDGNAEHLNGDFTPVAPHNTGRLIADDAETIIRSLKQDGVTIPNEINDTPNQVLRLVRTIETCLLQIEEYYELEREREQKKAIILLGSAVSFLFYGFSSRQLLHRICLLGVTFLSFAFYPQRRGTSLQKARNGAIHLIDHLFALKLTNLERKQQIQGLITSAIEVEQRKRQTKLERQMPTAHSKEKQSTVVENNQEQRKRMSVAL